MWEQYKRTFFRIQAIIALVVSGVYLFFGHQWITAVIFFAVMQLGAIIGAAWGARLSAMLRRRQTQLPLRPVN